MLLDLLTRFQTLVVGVLGFGGVILTLFFNARLARRQRSDEREHERRVYRAALRVELQALRDVYTDRATMLETAPRGCLVPARAGTEVFDRLLDKIGLLSPEESAVVLRAFVLAKELPGRVRLLEADTFARSPEEPLAEWIRVAKQHTAAVGQMHAGFIERFDEALRALEK